MPALTASATTVLRAISPRAGVFSNLSVMVRSMTWSAADLELVAELIVPADVGDAGSLPHDARRGRGRARAERRGAGRPEARPVGGLRRRDGAHRGRRRHRRHRVSHVGQARSRSASATAAATPDPGAGGLGFSLLRQLCSRLDVVPAAPRARAGSCASRRRFRPDGELVIARRPRDGARAGCVARLSSWRCDSSSAPISSLRPGETRISSSSFRLSAFASRLDVCWTAHTMIRVTSETTSAVVESTGPSLRPDDARSSPERAGRRRRRRRT